MPTELWFGPGAKKWLSNGEDVALRANLSAAVAVLANELLEGLVSPCDADKGGDTGSCSNVVENKVVSAMSSPQRWLWALEDWAMASLLLRGDEDNDNGGGGGSGGSGGGGNGIHTKEPVVLLPQIVLAREGGLEHRADSQCMAAGDIATLLASGEEGLQLLGSGSTSGSSEPSEAQLAGAVQITIVVGTA